MNHRGKTRPGSIRPGAREGEAGQLQGARNSCVIIEQAKGALARTHDIDVDTAFTLLRTYAQNHNRKLTDVAHAVLADPASVPDLARQLLQPPHQRR